MNGRHDHVGRAFVPQLNDPFPEIGFGHFETLGFQMIVQMGLLGRHGFGFDNGLNAIVPADFGDDLVGLLSGCGQMHDGARRLGPEP